MKILRLDTVDSTNTLAKKLCREHPEAKEILLLTAREQTAGRGRTGKSFSSLRDNGLYMTAVLPVNVNPRHCLFMTAAAAVATLEVLAEYGCKGLGIKWVNDLYLKDRKVCGILVEAVTDQDTGLMHHAVIGIGINLGTNLSALPQELQNKAGAILSLSVSREELSIVLTNRIADLVSRCLRDEKVLQEMMARYRSYSILTGRKVSWETTEGQQEGTVAGIDNDGRLLVDTDGGRVCLDSGYVSIRL